MKNIQLSLLLVFNILSINLLIAQDCEVVLINLTQISCNGEMDGKISVGPSSNCNGSISYYWSNGELGPDIGELGAGSYTVTIVDMNGQFAEASYDIIEPLPIEIILLEKTDNTCYGDEQGYLEIGALGGTPSFDFEWSNGETTNSIESLNGGIYDVTVTDQNGCQAFDTYFINEPNDLLITFYNITDASCNGLSDGSIHIEPSGATPPFDIDWSNGESGNFIDDLGSGEYEVTITDDSSCSWIESYTVGEPNQINIQLLETYNLSCYQSMDGELNISVEGGSGSLDILWSTGETETFIEELEAGSYSVTVTDETLCTQEATYEVSEPNQLEVNLISLKHVDCFGNENGSIEVEGFGGTPNYEYLWSNGESSSQITDLGPGTYTLSLTDDNNCLTTNEYIIYEPTQLELIDTEIIHVSCFNGEDGEIEINPTGATPPYTVLWSNNEDELVNSNLTSGTYTVAITDAEDCIYSYEFEIEEPEEIIINLENLNNVSCFDEEDGSISLSTSGGTGTIEYNWSNGQDDADINNLSPGTYTCTVTDENDCSKINSYVITQPEEINLTNIEIINVSCNGQADGGINLEAEGGTPNYSYNWSNGDNTEDISDLSAGTYFLTITDENNCTFTEAFEITEPDALQIELVNLSNNVCGAQNSGSIEILISGGNPTYEILWSNGETGPSISNLSSGVYSVIVTDDLGCTNNKTYEVISTESLLPSSEILTDCSCYNTADGSIELVMPNGQDYTYMWSNGESSESIQSLSPGVYECTVTSESACEFIGSYEILEPTEIKAEDISIENPNCSGDTTGLISFNILGGIAPYAIEWTYIPQSGGETLIEWTYNVTDTVSHVFAAGEVHAHVQDANGCLVNLESIVLVDPPETQINILAIDNPTCQGDTSGLISLYLSNAAAPYAIEWTYIPQDGGETLIEWTYNITDTVSHVFAAGEVHAHVQDANGCLVFLEPFILENKDSILLDEVKVSYTEGLGNIELVFLTDTTGQDYFWEGPNGFYSTEKDITGLKNGTYSCTITNSNSCTLVTNQIEITGSTSTKNLERVAFEIYPNPTSSILHIKFMENQSKTFIDVIQMNGESKIQKISASSSEAIDISHLPNGHYLLKVHTRDSVLYKSFIKSH